MADKANKAKLKEALQNLLSYRGVYFGNSSEESFKALETYARDQGILPKVRPGSDRDSYGNIPGSYSKAWSKDATKAEQLAELESCFETLLAWKAETPANIDTVIDALYKTYLEIVKPQLEENQGYTKEQLAKGQAEVKEALKTILKYKNDLPDELKDALVIVAEAAVRNISDSDDAKDGDEEGDTNGEE